MKGIVVTTDLEIRIEEFSDPLYKPLALLSAAISNTLSLRACAIRTA